jgi:hypothetical protein
MPGYELALTTSEPSLIKIQEAYYCDSDLVDSTGDLVLYRRNAFDDQVRFMQDEIIVEGALGWILGSPGTGKSVAAFAFAISKSLEDWTVIWVKLFPSARPVCLMLQGNQKFSAPCTTEMILHLLKQPASTNKHLLIVDGFVSNQADHVTIQEEAYQWRKLDKTNRRLIIVCSMLSRGKVSEGDDAVYKVREFLLYSWTKGEYVEALSIPVFRESVLSALDAAPETQLLDMIEQKFYYAGGSARYMFQFRTEDVIRKLRAAIRAIPIPPSSFFYWSNIRAENVINCLFSVFPGSGGRIYCESIVSDFAASELGSCMPPTAFQSVISLFNLDISGALFEAMFCCRLRNRGVSLTFSNGTKGFFAKASIRKFKATSESYVVEDEEWLKPESENNPGFDLVYVNRNAGFARFIQVTRGDDHDLNLDLCKIFITKLVNCPIKIVEFCFVVQNENLEQFRIPENSRLGQDLVKGRGALREWFTSGDTQVYWTTGSEHKQITKVGMHDIL